EQAGRSTPQELLLLLQMLTGAYELVRRSPMAQTILELAVVKLATREAWQSLDEISRRLEQAGAGAAPAGGTAATSRPMPPEALRSLPRSPSAEPAEPRAPARAPQPVPPTTAADSGEVPPPPAPEPTSAAPEPTSAAPEPAPAELPEAVRSTWPAFLERLGEKKMSLAAYLAHARPLSLEGGTLVVGLPGFALHQEVLSVAGHSRLIDQLLSELCGAALTVRYVTLADPAEGGAPASAPPAAETAAPPIVQEIVHLFNATILDQPRPTA
ncbi:MAG: hypothetical protein HYZ91_06080, partial [Candidatus Omnitrophica bacterium]|nr:hypothetical protein [Candidatus Omnitrophota bacterium]